MSAFMMVDNIPVPIEGEENILAVIRKAGIQLPTFCYYSELSVYGACRMCMVEDKRGSIQAACSTPPRPTATWAVSGSSSTVTLSTPSRSPRLTASTWWPWARPTGTLKS